MKIKHSLQWNCNQCDFQATTRSILMNHCKMTRGHTPSKQRLGESGVVECFTCRSEFRSYHDLMNHRKQQHPSHKRCRYYLKGECKFSRDECWYLHEEKGQTQNIEAKVEEMCFVCKINFANNFDLEKHKQEKHKRITPSKYFEKSTEESRNKQFTQTPTFNAWAQPLQSMQNEDFLPEPVSSTTRSNISNDYISHAQSEDGLFKHNVTKVADNGGKNVSQANLNNLTIIRRSNKPIQALNLPVIANVNPRSVYNKVKEFHTFVEQEYLDVVFMSESWEREENKLHDIIKLENHEVISNVYQRKGTGGRPALIVNKKKFHIQNLTNIVINIKWGIEVVWCLLTPLNATPNSKIQKIACASLYCKPGSKHKSDLLDHIAEAYNLLCTKYQRGLHFIIAGDTNELNLSPILALSPNLTQIVTKPTRIDPVTGVEALLDPVIMTLASYYQTPNCLAPLDADPEGNGKPSDHRIILASPISSINNVCSRTTRSIKVRPKTES